MPQIRAIVLALLLGSTSAHASFVKSCTLDGTVVEEPTHDQDGVWRFEVDVTSAGRGLGRSDGGCEELEGRQRIELHLPATRTAPGKGRPVRLRYFEKHNRGSRPFHTFTLVPRD